MICPPWLTTRPPTAQTDTSRLQTLELQTQKRVAAELKKLQEQEAAALRDAKENISTAAAADASNVESAMSRHTVAREVEGLRKKLEERRQVRALPEGVETARGAVVRCLRENDRRPLDCWQEVERFKEEVRKLEKGWVEKVVS